MMGLGAPEIMIILVVVLVLFGARRLPEMGRSLGQGIREFRKGIREIRGDLEESIEAQPPTQKP